MFPESSHSFRSSGDGKARRKKNGRTSALVLLRLEEAGSVCKEKTVESAGNGTEQPAKTAQFIEQNQPEARARGVPCSRFGLVRKSAPSALLELGDAIDRLLELFAGVVGKTVLHQEGIFATVFVVAAQHAHRPEALLAEEQLRPQVRFAHLQRDARATMARQLADQLRDHLRADPRTTTQRMHGEIQNVQL